MKNVIANGKIETPYLAVYDYSDTFINGMMHDQGSYSYQAVQQLIFRAATYATLRCYM